MITIDGGTGIIFHNGVEVASEKMVDFWYLNADIDSYNYGHVYVSALLDITNTSTHKVRFNLYSSYGGFDYNGDTTTNETSATFTRVGGT